MAIRKIIAMIGACRNLGRAILFAPQAQLEVCLQLLVELAGRAGDEDPAGYAALAVFQALDDASGFATLGTVRALGSVHYFFAIRCLCNLHCLSPDIVLLTEISRPSHGSNGWTMSCPAAVPDPMVSACPVGSTTSKE